MKYCERCGIRPRTYWPSKLCDYCLHMPFHPIQAMEYEKKRKLTHPEEFGAVITRMDKDETVINVVENNMEVTTKEKGQVENSMGVAYTAMGFCGLVGLLSKGIEGLFLGVAFGFAVVSFVYICKAGLESLK